jgi:hypothetical protein
MKIVPIFANQLFAIQYTSKGSNEYDRLMDLWTNVEYLRNYAKNNQIQNTKEFIDNIIRDAEYIQDVLAKIEKEEEPLETFFRPLNDLETNITVLSLQKGKIKRSTLRLYAIKIDTNLFVITGGAIKLHDVWKMKDHPDTSKELKKLDRTRNFLKENDVFDEDSFYELLNEQ